MHFASGNITVRGEEKGGRIKIMSANNFETTFSVDQSPKEVFAAVNNVRGWWSGEVEGQTDHLGAEFTYNVPGMHYSKQRVTENSPSKKVVWHVTDANLSFVDKKTERKDTEIVFEISPKGNKTQLHFQHIGLEPACECYDACSNGWSLLVNGNLQNLVITGKVQPSPW